MFFLIFPFLHEHKIRGLYLYWGDRRLCFFLLHILIYHCIILSHPSHQERKRKASSSCFSLSMKSLPLFLQET
ncbi:hypothetical protein CSUI_009803 [Cystoisospora suis]|uniref:Uncharacterized protein n=1 Tax=Cystoisospora suis TaxID=483139 RepID=A0A2C6KIZ9_9APIC|nr:hypothetical protein CSUI_009803 [Cystoisospora suis]